MYTCTDWRFLFIYYIYLHVACVTKAAARLEWQKAVGLPSVGSLVKQRTGMLEKVSLGQVWEVEAAILNSIDLSSCLAGNSKVEVGKDLCIHASFDAGDSMICKKLETVKAAYEFLLTMLQSYKSGDLHKNIGKAAKAAAPAVRLEKAANGVLSKEQPADLPEVVATLPGSGAEMKDMENVTEKFLTISKTSSSAMLQSTLCLHKGSMNSVLALGNAQHSFCGLFLAKEAWNSKWHVTQIVLSTSSVEETLKHERVKARCKSLGLVPAGALVVGSHKDWRQHLESIFELFKFKAPMVAVVDFSSVPTGDMACWECDVESLEDEKVRACTCSPVTQPHQHANRLTYNVCWLDDLGSSHIETATKYICDTMIKHIDRRLSTSKSWESEKFLVLCLV